MESMDDNKIYDTRTFNKRIDLFYFMLYVDIKQRQQFRIEFTLFNFQFLSFLLWHSYFPSLFPIT